MQFRHEFATGRTATNNDEREETIALHCGNGGVGRAFEAFEDAVADLAGVVEVFEEEDNDTFKSLDAACFMDI